MSEKKSLYGKIDCDVYDDTNDYGPEHWHLQLHMQPSRSHTAKSKG